MLQKIYGVANIKKGIANAEWRAIFHSGFACLERIVLTDLHASIFFHYNIPYFTSQIIHE